MSNNYYVSPTLFALTIIIALITIFMLSYLFTPMVNYIYGTVNNETSTLVNDLNITSTILPQPSVSPLTSAWSYIIDAAAGVLIIGFIIGIAKVRHT